MYRIMCVEILMCFVCMCVFPLQASMGPCRGHLPLSAAYHHWGGHRLQSKCVCLCVSVCCLFTGFKDIFLVFQIYQTAILVLFLPLPPKLIHPHCWWLFIKNLNLLIFCQRTNRHPDSIVIILIQWNLVKIQILSPSPNTFEVLVWKFQNIEIRIWYHD